MVRGSVPKPPWLHTTTLFYSSVSSLPILTKVFEHSLVTANEATKLKSTIIYGSRERDFHDLLLGLPLRVIEHILGLSPHCHNLLSQFGTSHHTP